MMPRKVLHIVSDYFPYGSAEQFFEAEILEMAPRFDEIILYPLKKKDGLRVLPENVKVNDVLNQTNRNFSKRMFFQNLGLIFRIMGTEFIHSPQRMYMLKYFKRWMRSIIQCKQLGEAFSIELQENEGNYFYSFWMNDGALILSILKAQRKIKQFNFRINGFDIFDERHEGSYLPFRFFNFKHVQKVFVLSKEALSYVKAIGFKPEKLMLAHYGIYDKGVNQFDKTNTVRIVSCSNLIPLKRIDKIIGALSHLENHQIHWTHFGDGPLMGQMKKMAEDKLQDNIRIDFRGSVPNEEIIDLYQNTSINLFIHTSETEGLGMAIIEAQSFGIPAVVIGVGGVVDIVSDQTGMVLKPNVEDKEIANAIEKVLSGKMNSSEYRETIKAHCFSIFAAQKNYEIHASRILESKS